VRNLMALLMTRDAEELSRIAGWWSVELPRASAAERAAVLGREMLRDSSAHRLWERLDEPSRQLFLAFADRPEQRLSDLRRGRDDPALGACLEAGVLWAFEESEREGGLPSLSLPPVSDPTLVLPPEVQRLATRLRVELEQGDTSGFPLQESLERLGTGELENLAAYWGLAAEPGSYTRDELVDSLVNRLSGASTERVYTEAPETARVLYEALIRAGGKAPTRELAEAAGIGGPELRDAVADLGERLLALEAYRGADGWLLYAPEGPEHVLPGDAATDALEPAEAPERHTPAPAWAAAWDLINLLRALELYDVPDEDGGFPEAFSARFDSSLCARPDDPGANLRWLHEPTHRARAWAETGMETQSKRLLQHWVEQGTTADDACLEGAPGYRHDAETLRDARRTVLGHLARCEPGTWYPVDALVTRVRAQCQFLVRPQNRLVRELGAAGARKAMEGWNRVEGAWLRGLVGGVLGWLHVVETVAEPAPLFTLTPDGAWLSGRVGRPPVATPPPRLAVTEEGRVRIVAPDGRTLWALAGFARPVRTARGPGYLIDRRSVARARSGKIDTGAILAVLRKHAENGVPPRLAGLIQEWGREPHRIGMRPALLVECETESGAAELMASPIARPHGPRRVDATTVLLHLPRENMDEELQTLMRRLTRSGLFSAEKPKR
jgi:hypothetical protein